MCAAVLPPLIVVLDLDECLIHSTGFSCSAAGIRQDEASRPAHASASSGIESFRANFQDTTGRVSTCLVLKRQGVDDFLEACCTAYETYVFTAGTQLYADAVLDKLDPERRLAGRFYRSDCSQIHTHCGDQYLKDLEVVAKTCGRRGDLSRMVLVDNNIMSFLCQPQNGIPVPDFVGEKDDTLPRVLQLIKSLSIQHEDVRKPLDHMFGLAADIRPMQDQLFGKGGGPVSKL